MMFAAGFSSYANDSTLLQQRMAKIGSLTAWLKQLPAPAFHSDGDSTNVWKAYAITRNNFFRKPYPKSPAEWRFGLFYYHDLVFDSGNMKVELPDLKASSKLTPDSSRFFLDNALVLYATVDDFKFEVVYFLFEPGTDELIFILEAGGDEAEYQRKMTFLNSLSNSLDRSK
jgi:hypothetical protein